MKMAHTEKKSITDELIIMANGGSRAGGFCRLPGGVEARRRRAETKRANLFVRLVGARDSVKGLFILSVYIEKRRSNIEK